MTIEKEEKATPGSPKPSMASAKDGEVEEAHMTGNTDDIDALNLDVLGYKPELHRNRSMITLLFQSLAIAAIPYGEGGPLISAIYGGGQLSIFVGWISRYTRFRACHAGIELVCMVDVEVPGVWLMQPISYISCPIQAIEFHNGLFIGK